MNLRQLHDYGACSSMMLYNLGDIDGGHEYNQVEALVRLWTSELETSATLNEGTYPRHMSFVVASVGPYQAGAILFLKKIGMKGTKNMWPNQKNGTTCGILVAPAVVVTQNLKKLLEKHKDTLINLLNQTTYDAWMQELNNTAPPPEDWDDEDDDWDWDDDE